MPSSISGVGFRVSLYNEWTGSPVASSTPDSTRDSATPRIPCSGENSATSSSSGIARSRSIVARPVGPCPNGS